MLLNILSFAIVLNSAEGSLPAAQPDPQLRLREISLSSVADERVELFSSGDAKILRFRPSVDAESLVRLIRDGGEPVVQIDILVKPTGLIDGFKVVRSEASEIFKISVENAQLKFLRLKDDNFSFPSISEVRTPLASKFSEVINFLTQKSSADVNQTNQKVLRALRILATAEPVETASKDSLPDDPKKKLLNLIDEDLEKAPKSASAPDPKI